MNIKDKVKVKLPDGFIFTGVITGIRGVEIIVKYNELEVNDRRTSSYDPEGCLIVHSSYMEVIQ